MNADIEETKPIDNPQPDNSANTIDSQIYISLNPQSLQAS
jgi:hypothetical protein